MPPTPRTLVLCFDGTGDGYDETNSNIVKFFSLLKKEAMDQQLCYYQAGIGTYFSPGVVSPLFTWCAQKLDEAFAWYLYAHVQDGYKFLMKNYRAGDKICLFGFSRGAYTARGLAGMLVKVGLLPKDNDEQVNFAYKLYTRTDAEGFEKSASFKKAFSRQVTIEFIGVWDTVGSVGIMSGSILPFVDSGNHVKTFRHALSLDERRSRFRPHLFLSFTSEVDPAILEYESTTPEATQKLSTPPDGQESNQGPSENGKNSAGTMNGWTAYLKERTLDDALEVWFAGYHSDVGGATYKNGTLSRITLRWMVREVIASKCGIQFDDARVGDLISSETLFETQADPNQSETDMSQLFHDRMRNPMWWILEFLPLRYSFPIGQGVWRSTVRWNLGRGRNIPLKSPNFHISVKDLMKRRYKPNATWEGDEVYVN